MTPPSVLTRGRQYVSSHPWISFRLDTRKIDPSTWMMLGETQSKCEHIAHVPLRPEVGQQLLAVYISKGAHGTTSIEGNTLSEDEVLRRMTGELDLPVSREYLGAEIDNVVHLYNQITQDTLAGNPPSLCADTIKDYHRVLFQGQPTSDHNIPGQFRHHSVGVLRYLGPPAEDCEYLIDRMCAWLDSDDFKAPAGREDLAFALNVLKAMMAHLYVAWIHPFGDGNGRIARLLEFQLLFQAGVPLPACHVLQDHYNRTRDAYYLALERTSRAEGYPVEVFIRYAMQGFVDELREQLGVVRDHQHEVTWENYVHDRFRDQDTAARRRQKHIALDLPADEPTPRSKLRTISTRVAEEYVGKTSKTVTRDLNALADMNLIRRSSKGIAPNRGITSAFLAVRADA